MTHELHVDDMFIYYLLFDSFQSFTVSFMYGCWLAAASPGFGITICYSIHIDVMPKTMISAMSGVAGARVCKQATGCFTHFHNEYYFSWFKHLYLFTIGERCTSFEPLL